MDCAQHLLGGGAEEDAVARIDQAAGDDQLDVLVIGKERGNGQGIGDELDVQAEQFLREIKSGRAAVEEDGLAVLDQLPRGLGDSALGVGAIFGALIESVGAGRRIFIADPDDAAVGAVDQPFLLEYLNIAADGGFGDAKLPRERVQIADAATGQKILQTRLSLGN
jgi:hypothetical protein